MAQGEIDRRRHLFTYCRMSFDLFSDRFDCRVRPQEAVCKRLVLSQESEQQVLGLNVRTSELTRFVSCKEDNPSSFLRISFKHRYHHQDGLRLETLPLPVNPYRPDFPGCLFSTLKPDRTVVRTSDCA